MTQLLEELQIEVEQSRAKLDSTLDQLEEKLTVSGIVDDLLGTARRSQFAPLLDHALETVKRNPIPLLLVATGIGLLLHRLQPKFSQERAQSSSLAMDEDLSLQGRMFETGTTNVPSREDPEGYRREANSRI